MLMSRLQRIHSAHSLDLPRSMSAQNPRSRQPSTAWTCQPGLLLGLARFIRQGIAIPLPSPRHPSGICHVDMFCKLPSLRTLISRITTHHVMVCSKPSASASERSRLTGEALVPRNYPSRSSSGMACSTDRPKQRTIHTGPSSLTACPAT